MPKYKLSPEERALEQERKENLRNIMKDLDAKNKDEINHLKAVLPHLPCRDSPVNFSRAILHIVWEKGPFQP